MPDQPNRLNKPEQDALRRLNYLSDIINLPNEDRLSDKDYVESSKKLIKKLNDNIVEGLDKNLKTIAKMVKEHNVLIPEVTYHINKIKNSFKGINEAVSFALSKNIDYIKKIESEIAKLQYLTSSSKDEKTKKIFSDQLKSIKTKYVQAIIDSTKDIATEDIISEKIQKSDLRDAAKATGNPLWFMSSTAVLNAKKLAETNGFGGSFSGLQRSSAGLVAGAGSQFQALAPTIANLVGNFNTFTLAVTAGSAGIFVLSQIISRLINLYDFSRKVHAYSYGITGDFNTFVFSDVANYSPLYPKQGNLTNVVGIDWQSYANKTLSEFESSRVLSKNIGQDIIFNNSVMGIFENIQKFAISLGRYGVSFDDAISGLIRYQKIFNSSQYSLFYGLTARADRLGMSLSELESSVGDLTLSYSYGQDAFLGFVSKISEETLFKDVSIGESKKLISTASKIASMDFTKQVGLQMATGHMVGSPLRSAYASIQTEKFLGGTVKSLVDFINVGFKDADKGTKAVALSQLIGADTTYTIKNYDKIMTMLANNDIEGLKKDIDGNELDKGLQKMSQQIGILEKILGALQSIVDILVRYALNKLG